MRTSQKTSCHRLISIQGFFALLFLGVFACSSPQKRSVEIAFYHWQSAFALDSIEQSYIHNLSAQKLYVRFFDVDWKPSEQEAVPIGEVKLSRDYPPQTQIIPTIFMTNRTFQKIPESKLSALAKNLIQKITYQYDKLSSIPLQEVQIDCDWSESTRYSYFQFLELLQKLWEGDQVKISVTIRLHQLRYPKMTGIPPVNRGTLMFYNMGKLDDLSTNNSILDLEIARSYIPTQASYPLHLDLALPLFSWGVLFRQNRVVNLLSNLSKKDLEDKTKYQARDELRFQVLKNHYQAGILLYKGDIIRWEEVALTDLQKSIQLLQKVLPRDSTRLTFYHLDKNLLEHYSKSDLKSLAQDL